VNGYHLFKRKIPLQFLENMEFDIMLLFALPELTLCFDINLGSQLFPGGNFINILRAYFLYKILAPKIPKLLFGFKFFCRQNFVQKTRALNVDEIDGRWHLPF